MASSFLLSTLLMGTLAALVLVAVLRSRRWYSYSPETGARVGGLSDESRPPVWSRPATWILAFVGLTALAVGGVFAFVTNPDAPAGLLSAPVLGVGGLLLVGYLTLGVYHAAKERGHPASIAAAETATVLGVLFLVAVSAQLIG